MLKVSLVIILLILFGIIPLSFYCHKIVKYFPILRWRKLPDRGSVRGKVFAKEHIVALNRAIIAGTYLLGFLSLAMWIYDFVFPSSSIGLKSVPVSFPMLIFWMCCVAYLCSILFWAAWWVICCFKD